MPYETKQFAFDTLINTIKSVFQDGKPRNEYDLMMFIEHKLLNDYNVTTQYPGVDLNDDSRDSRINMVVWDKSSSKVSNASAFEIIYKMSEDIDRYGEPINDNGSDKDTVVYDCSEIRKFISQYKPTLANTFPKVHCGYVLYVTDNKKYLEDILDTLESEKQIDRNEKAKIVKNISYFAHHTKICYCLSYKISYEYIREKRTYERRHLIDVYIIQF